MKIDQSVAAVVTGGSSGLGEATARALAAAGARVAIFDLNEERGRAVAEEIGGVFCRVDVASSAEVEAAFAAARAAHGQERILVNCAGIVAAKRTVVRDKATGTLSAHPADLFEKVIQINLIGAFRCLSVSAAGMATLPPLKDGERGLIVNTASVAATDGQIGQAAYSASKAGVMGLTLPVARDLSSDGIRVNSIMPGIFDTPMVASMPAAVQASLAAGIPFPSRLGRPEDFAGLVMAICENRYLNGESIRLDGAVRLAPR